MFPVNKDDFIGLGGLTHLASGGQPPLLKSHREAFDQFAADKSCGLPGYGRHWELADRLRLLIGKMVGLPASDIAFQANASEGIGKVLNSINWRNGDNVVCASIDYPAGRFAAADLKHKGVEARMVEPDGWFVDPMALLDACDARTRLVYLSHVNAHTGQRLQIDEVSDTLNARGIPLLLDASHSMGVLPVDARKCDFLVSSTYKFLMGPHTGIFAWNRERWPAFDPHCAGRFSAMDHEDPARFVLRSDARRAEAGNLNHLAHYLLEKSLLYLAQFPAQNIERHVLELSGALWQGAVDLGLPVLTPEGRGHQSANVSIETQAPRALVDDAAQNGILIWGDAHRIRMSLHIFNDRNDVERALDWLPEGLERIKGLSEPKLWT